jgi:hypothetical protein
MAGPDRGLAAALDGEHCSTGAQFDESERG